MRNAAVMLIIKDGLILSISRRNDKTKFGLPGGRVEPDETPADAARRETFEETGIRVNDCQLIYRRVEPKESPDGEDFNTFCYLAIEWIGTAHNSEEGEVAWLTEAELTGPNGAFADYNSETIKVYRTKFPTFK
jgi:8-oxo-dGTP diphosphatase